MKRIVILGSTGSIGTQALSVIEKNRDKFEVYALSAHSNIDLLLKQIKKFKPKKVALYSEIAADRLSKMVKHNGEVKILAGSKGLEDISSDRKADVILVAVTGINGLPSVMNALKNKICVALANKESLVSGGRFVVEQLRVSNGMIIPVDSEHSAIFQLLSKAEKSAVRRVVLTASGGPFRGKSLAQIKNANIKEVLKHPRWNMGKKVSVDSATMVNKAFEMIEAKWLFDLSSDRINVVIHPQAIVHSLIQLVDGSYIAHIGPTDMRAPIAYALSYPERLDNVIRDTHLSELEDITFEKVRYPFNRPLNIARHVIDYDNDMGIVFNAADEVAVELFLQNKISFGDIGKIIEYSIKHFKPSGIKTINDVLLFDMEIKTFIRKYVSERF
ncbi:MAG: 1-deoxy-D-xylulose-5-phosphate reductoisomerase [Deltaproteobacteria bacterium]|nr:1-deoxy-D-xylulose-5-phosphate reductoisomerase [Deltaproteobacteria bacterium]